MGTPPTNPTQKLKRVSSHCDCPFRGIITIVIVNEDELGDDVGWCRETQIPRIPDNCQTACFDEIEPPFRRLVSHLSQKVSHVSEAKATDKRAEILAGPVELVGLVGNS